MEWDPDNASSCCVICQKPWGTFRNRRHHCRHCGRLVCESCSKKKLILGEQEVFQHSKSPSHLDGTTPRHGEDQAKPSDDLASKAAGLDSGKISSSMSKPKRVCDACYKLLTKKNEVKLELNMKREREQALLQTSSHVCHIYI